MAAPLVLVPLVVAFLGYLSGRHARRCLYGGMIAATLLGTNVWFLAWAFSGPGRSGALLLATLALVMVNAPLLIGLVAGVLTSPTPAPDRPGPCRRAKPGLAAPVR